MNNNKKKSGATKRPSRRYPKKSNNSNLIDIKNKFLSGISVPDKLDFKPDDFQLEAISALSKGEDTLVIAPTGAGKTYIAVEAISSMLKEGKKSIYTAPLKALSNSKYSELKKKFEPEHKVGLLTGDRKIDTDADVVVATTEIYRNDLYEGVQNYSLVVLDELHYLADISRGAVWEESIILSSINSNLLMLSASISNPEEIAAWIKSVRKKEVRIIKVEKRPVELRMGFLHPEEGVLPLNSNKSEVHSEVEKFYKEENKRSNSRGKFSRNKRSRKGPSRKRPRK